MDFHTQSYKSPDPEVPIQSLYIGINRVTQTVSLGLPVASPTSVYCTGAVNCAASFWINFVQETWSRD